MTSKDNSPWDYVFVYGSLTQPKIQLKVIGRICESWPDKLEGFYLDDIVIDGEKQPIAVYNQESIHSSVLEIPMIRKALAMMGAEFNDDHIDGVVLKIFASELDAINEHQTDAYICSKTILASGEIAYTHYAPHTNI